MIYQEIKKVHIRKYTGERGQKILKVDGVDYTISGFHGKYNFLCYEYIKKLVLKRKKNEFIEEINNKIFVKNNGYNTNTIVYRYKSTGERFTVHDVVKISGASQQACYTRIQRWIKDPKYTDDMLFQDCHRGHNCINGQNELSKMQKGPKIDINSIPGPTEFEVRYGLV